MQISLCPLTPSELAHGTRQPDALKPPALSEQGWYYLVAL